MKRLLMVSALCLNAIGASAQFPPVGAPPPVSLQVPLVPQTTPVWCWLAVAEMAIRYRNLGRGLSQCQMMEIGYGVPPGSCCGNQMMCMRTGGLSEIQGVIQRFGGRFSIMGPPTDPMTLYSFLQRGAPVIAAIQSSPFSGHVVLIRGMRFAVEPVMGPFGPQPQVIPYVLVNDPMSLIPGDVPYSMLLGRWGASIVVL